MKKVRVIPILLVVLLTSSMSRAETSNITPGNRNVLSKEKICASQTRQDTKFGSGIKNTLFGWMEIPESIQEVTNDTKNPLWGLTAGTLKGVGKALPRTVYGISNIVSFPIDNQSESTARPDEIKSQQQ